MAVVETQAPSHRAPSETTRLFRRWRAGEVDADERLTPTIYAELRNLAGRQLRRERRGHTLQPTELVHEAYIRLIGTQGSVLDRHHFIALASRTMRHVLVDHARRRQAAKRFSSEERVTLTTGVMVEGGDGPSTIDMLDLDRALEQLALVNPRAARVVELRYFGGLTCDEASTALELSRTSVERSWRAARAWLRHELVDRADADRTDG